MTLYLCICVFVVRRKAKKQRAVLERRHLLCGVAINALLLSSYIAEIEKKESEAMSNIDQANKEKPRKKEQHKYNNPTIQKTSSKNKKTTTKQQQTKKNNTQKNKKT